MNDTLKQDKVCAEQLSVMKQLLNQLRMIAGLRLR